MEYASDRTRKKYRAFLRKYLSSHNYAEGYCENPNALNFSVCFGQNPLFFTAVFLEQGILFHTDFSRYLEALEPEQLSAVLPGISEFNQGRQMGYLLTNDSGAICARVFFAWNSRIFSPDSRCITNILSWFSYVLNTQIPVFQSAVLYGGKPPAESAQLPQTQWHPLFARQQNRTEAM